MWSERWAGLVMLARSRRYTADSVAGTDIWNTRRTGHEPRPAQGTAYGRRATANWSSRTPASRAWGKARPQGSAEAKDISRFKAV